MNWHTSSYSAYNGNCVQVAWQKASASVGNGACVEVGWEKSSHSGYNNCVEVGAGACGMVHVRDSKDPDGGMLSFRPADWMEFVATLKG